MPFKISDAWGIIAAALTLVLVYLILEHGSAGTMLINSTASASNSLLKTLQGR